jgi:hypothetical protein
MESLLTVWKSVSTVRSAHGAAMESLDAPLLSEEEQQQDGEYSDAMLEDQRRALLTTEFSREQLAEVVARSGKSESEILRLIDIIFEDR